MYHQLYCMIHILCMRVIDVAWISNLALRHFSLKWRKHRPGNTHFLEISQVLEMPAVDLHAKLWTYQHKGFSVFFLPPLLRSCTIQHLNSLSVIHALPQHNGFSLMDSKSWGYLETKELYCQRRSEVKCSILLFFQQNNPNPEWLLNNSSITESLFMDILTFPFSLLNLLHQQVFPACRIQAATWKPAPVCVCVS